MVNRLKRLDDESMNSTIIWFTILLLACPALLPAAESDEDMGYIRSGLEKPAGSSVPTAPQDIAYARDDIPAVDYPPFGGRRYEMMIPDTLDLAERARLAIHGITECADPVYDYAIFGWIGLPKNGRVIARHSYHGYNGGQAKWMQNLALMRTMSGSDYNIDIDVKMMETMFHMLGEDGLYYIPIQGMPWIGVADSGEPYTKPGKKMVSRVTSGRGKR